MLRIKSFGFEEMRHIYMCFVQFVSALMISGLTHAQTDDRTEDYVLHDSDSLCLDDRQCSRLIRTYSRKVDKLTGRLRETNNKYLHLYMLEEDAFLHSLCNYIVPPSVCNSHDQPMILNSGFGFADTSSNQNLVPVFTDYKKPTLPSSEIRAEALMMDCWYSFNRFENLCQRLGHMPSNKKVPELDSINLAMDYLNQMNKSDQHAKTSLNIAIRNLNFERQRTELIQNYIHEQQDFLSSVMAKQPQSSNLMKPLSDCAGYYKAQVKENMSLFTDRTRLETLLIKHLRSMDAKAFITSLPIAAVQNVASSAMKSESGALLTIDELLKKAPQVTKEELSSLNENNNMSTESAQQVAPHEMSSDSTLTTKGTSLHNTASDSSFTKREILKPKGSNQIGLNPLKTKRPIDRFKVNCNFQLAPSTRFFPSSGMLSLGLAYQYLPSGCVGMSFTYNQPLPKRVFSSEDREIIPAGKGYGMRTFVDYRLKGNLFIMAGFDFGLRSEIQSNKKSQTDLVHYQSALMGLKVRYSSKKSRCQPTMEILYDFLHGKTGQPAVVTRFGFDLVRKHGLR